MPTVNLTGQADTVSVATDLSVVINSDPSTPGDGLLIDGLAGLDTLQFTGGNYDSWLTSFSLTATAAGLLTLTSGALSVQFDNFEKLVFTDVTIDLGTAGADTITGGALDDAFLFGLGGNDTIDGGAGADTMYGDGGDDTYIVDNLLDKVIEAAAGGTDLVKSSVTYTLAANADDLTLTGTGDINGTGNALDNTITGNTGANRLSGAGGADTLIGLAGDDIYVITAAGDTITETAGAAGGIDTVEASITVASLAANVENLTLTGTTGIDGTGNGLDNLITGNSGNNTLSGLGGNDTLDGGGGSDTLVGGAGDDIYILNVAGDVITETVTGGRDLAKSSVTVTDLDANVEDLTLTGTGNINGGGNALDNTITGNGGNNALTGGLGDDTLAGGAGTDLAVLTGLKDDYSFEVLVSGDVKVTDSVAARDGVDVISQIENVKFSDGTFTLAFLLSGGSVINGNASANTIAGTAGNDVINGLGGDDTLGGSLGEDTLNGGTGNDTFIINSLQDLATEKVGEGTHDLVKSSITISSLWANIEDITLLDGADANATGNGLDNILTGNSGNNTLKGLGGTDQLKGLGGNDIYVIDALDTVTETLNQGLDEVQAGFTVSNLFANVENLTLLEGGAFNATGNSLNNTITGNSSANQLYGAGGTDTLIGGGGNDTYIVDSAADTVVELSGGGFDTVQSTLSQTVLAAFVENLNMTGSGIAAGYGNSLDNTIVGNSSANSIDGGEGADDMTGGAGNDVYVVDNAGDRVHENAGGGRDTIITSVSLGSLAANIEDVSLIGMDSISVVGNGFDNRITGNAGNNVINGSGGADYMSGGFGDDTYYIDNAGDVIKEYYGLGNDTIYTSVEISARAYVENLVLLGDVIKANGNGQANLIVGNARANVITGGGGGDTMRGGAGSDVYAYNLVSDSRAGVDHDSIQGFMHGFDKINLSKIDANGSRTGNGAFTFIGGAGFNGSAGALHAVKSGSLFIVEGDVNGDRVADLQIFVGGALKITASDFIL